jgi:hypothetical protein
MYERTVSLFSFSLVMKLGYEADLNHNAMESNRWRSARASVFGLAKDNETLVGDNCPTIAVVRVSVRVTEVITDLLRGRASH